MITAANTLAVVKTTGRQADGDCVLCGWEFCCPRVSRVGHQRVTDGELGDKKYLNQKEILTEYISRQSQSQDPSHPVTSTPGFGGPSKYNEVVQVGRPRKCY